MKFYVSSIDANLEREIVVSAPCAESAMLKVWKAELRDLRAIPAESLKFLNAAALMFDPELYVHEGRESEKLAYSTCCVFELFDADDQLLIARFIQSSWGNETLSTFLTGVRNG